MSPADLRRAIELPAARRGLLLQPGLVDTILEDLADEPGALPLLSHALLETWKRRRRLMLTVGGYREAGGVRGAIAQTAERTLQSLLRSRPRDRALDLPEPDRRRRGRRADAPARRPRRARRAPQVADARCDRVLGILADARLRDDRRAHRRRRPRGADPPLAAAARLDRRRPRRSARPPPPDRGRARVGHPAPRARGAVPRGPARRGAGVGDRARRPAQRARARLPLGQRGSGEQRGRGRPAQRASAARPGERAGRAHA